MLCIMWNLLGRRIEPMSPALKEDAYPLHHQGKSKARFCVTVSQLTMSSKASIQGSVFPRYSKITSKRPVFLPLWHCTKKCAGFFFFLICFLCFFFFRKDSVFVCMSVCARARARARVYFSAANDCVLIEQCSGLISLCLEGVKREICIGKPRFTLQPG